MSKDQYSSAEAAVNAAADRFWESYRGAGRPDLDAIGFIAENALSPDPERSTIATSRLFGSIVEPLNDSFDPGDRQAYYRIFARVIDICRRLPEAAGLQKKLLDFGIGSEDDLLNRAGRIARREAVLPEDVGAAIFLSRVTPGADVAVTSVGLRVVADRFPQAELYIMGSARLNQLFGGDPRVRVLDLHYQRRGGLLDRFNAWISAAEAVGSLDHGSTVVIDPDSRISQLGLLPMIADDERYLFFNSSDAAEDDRRSLAEMFAAWMGQRFGGSPAVERIFPCVSLRREDLDLAELAFSRLGLNRRRVVSISFGVGGNTAKAMGLLFEKGLIKRLADSGWAIVLDRGAGREENEAADALMADQREMGASVARISRDSIPSVKCDVACWDGDMGGFAAIIGRSDQYVGYDSLFQHVAAAQGVPLVAVFAGFANPLFPARWRPTGPGQVHVIEAAAADAADLADHIRDLVERG